MSKKSFVMNKEQLISTCTIISTIAFLFRWLINWILLNRINKTDFSVFAKNAFMDNFFIVFRHVIVSEWKLWWTGEAFHKLKTISNILSAIFYISLALAGIVLLLSK
jgi:hypothetical protein